MTENQTQSSPQFIMWVKEKGVFIPAELKMPKDYIGYSLEKNVELGEQEISPDRLNLMCSVYLGPINIFEEQTWQVTNITSKYTLQRLREHEHETVYGIVKIAEEVAKGQCVQYFGVNVIQTEKDRTWKFTKRDDFLKRNDLEENYSSFDKCKSKKPLDFVLHPTAQLYVPRK